MDKNKVFSEFPHLVGDGVEIKHIEKEDADDLYEIYSNENLFEYTPWMMSKSKDTVRNKIQHFIRDFNKCKAVFAGIYKNQKLVGMLELFDFDFKANCVTLGYRINESYWNQGIASAATKSALSYLFNDLKVNRVQAFVMPENTASSKVLLKNDFSFDGVLREGAYWKGRGIVTLNIYSILRDEYLIK